MKSAPFPANETERQAQLDRFGVLDSLPQPAFDHITDLAAKICDTPVALISLVDRNRQWFKSRVGLDTTETGRDVSLCGHAILHPDELMEVRDASQDPRFADNPLVLGEPNIRFYAGAPIVTPEGHALGTVCVVDRCPRTLEPKQRDALRSLAALVTTLLEQERLQNEEALRHSADALKRAQMYQALLNVGRELKSFVDTDYVYQFVNPMYRRYWGREADGILGRKVADLVGEERFQRLVKPQMDKALAGQAIQFETEFDFPDLGLRHVDVSYLPARDESGAMLGVVVRVQDIEERRQRENDLNQALTSLQHKTLEQERFIHIVSHDLREPINTINNFAGLLAEEPAIAGSPGARRYLDFVVRGGSRMAALLDGLLNFVWLDRRDVDLQAVDLQLLAEQVREDLASLMAQTRGALHIESLPTVTGDSSLLRIVLQNLVTNALKFSRPLVAPVVTVSAVACENQWRIEVSDNGIGMPADQIDAVFDLFKRLHSRKQYDGTGLGLSICRRVAELHQGSISVSTELGQGSRFSLVLPKRPLPETAA